MEAAYVRRREERVLKIGYYILGKKINVAQIISRLDETVIIEIYC